MRKRLMFGSAVVLLGILVTLVVWQGSFNLSPAPSTIQQTYLFWAVSTLIFILTVTLGFIPVPDRGEAVHRAPEQPAGIAHQIEADRRRAGAERAARSFFLVLWSVSVLNLQPGQMVQPAGAHHEYRSGADRQRAATRRWRTN